ncbi:hypothetical protein N9283_03710 [Akkermansiaceae bacterium]|nr:hypothetical protein [Akkermansiaceae bacterium]
MKRSILTPLTFLTMGGFIGWGISEVQHHELEGGAKEDAKQIRISDRGTKPRSENLDRYSRSAPRMERAPLVSRSSKAHQEISRRLISELHKSHLTARNSALDEIENALENGVLGVDQRNILNKVRARLDEDSD